MGVVAGQRRTAGKKRTTCLLPRHLTTVLLASMIGLMSKGAVRSLPRKTSYAHVQRIHLRTHNSDLSQRFCRKSRSDVDVEASCSSRTSRMSRLRRAPRGKEKMQHEPTRYDPFSKHLPFQHISACVRSTQPLAYDFLMSKFLLLGETTKPDHQDRHGHQRTLMSPSSPDVEAHAKDVPGDVSVKLCPSGADVISPAPVNGCHRTTLTYLDEHVDERLELSEGRDELQQLQQRLVVETDMVLLRRNTVATENGQNERTPRDRSGDDDRREMGPNGAPEWSSYRPLGRGR